jgi:anti-sigma regulatory factor (Ser/Thr protein kinase)
MRDAGFSDQQILDMQLAIEEAITNSITHGYHGSPGTITVHGEAGPDLLTVEITDYAPAFDPLTMPNPDVTSSLEERRTGGLGIYLIRRVTDTVAYRYEQGKNILTLTKRK